MAYDAFISYSHAADGQLAPAMQRAMQRLAKPWYRSRALRVFRDESALSANPHLWSSIENALDESDWFVLLASPDAAESEWVGRELEYWLATKRADRILVVLTDGSLAWDGQCLSGTAVPDALRDAFSEEPRHLDLRWARTDTDLDMHNARFRDAAAQLAAPVHGVATDDLESEDVRLSRRARRLARGGVGALAVLVIVSLAFGTVAVVERNRANGEARRAELRGLVSESRALVSSNRPLALLLAAEASRRTPDDTNARDALLGAVLAEPRLQRSFGPSGSIAYGGRLTGTRVAVATESAVGPGHDVSVWDWNTEKQRAWPAAARVRAGRACSGAVALATSPDGERLAVATADGLLQVFSGRTLEAEGEPIRTGLDFPRCHGQIAFSAPDGRLLAVANADGRHTLNTKITGATVRLFERSADGWQPGPELPGHRIRVQALAFSRDSSMLATASPAGADPTTDPGLIVLHDVRTGKPGKRIETVDHDPLSLALDLDHRHVVAGSLVEENPLVYDLDAPAGAQPVAVPGVGRGTRPFYNAEGTQLAISGTNGIRFLDAAGLAPIRGADIEPNAGGGPVIFLPDDQILSVGGGPVTVWNRRATSVLQTVISEQPGGVWPTARPDVFTAFKSTKAGTFITILGPDFQPLHAEIKVGAPQLAGPGFCADPVTNRIATVGAGSPGHPGEVVIRRSVSPFDVLRRTPGVEFSPVDCTWRPDGQQIAISGTGGQVVRYQVSAGEILPVKGAGESDIPFLVYRDSNELWATTPGGAPPVRITNLDGTPRVTPVPALGAGSALRFTPDGRSLVVADAQSVRVFDAQSLEPRRGPVPVSMNLVFYVRVSPDGGTAVISDVAGSMQRIDLRAGRVIGTPIHMGLSSAAVFGRDDATIYAQAPVPDGRPTVWDFAPDHVRDEACALAGRNLTPEEWHQYLPWAGSPRATCPQFTEK